jgi:hypothetical protein
MQECGAARLRRLVMHRHGWLQKPFAEGAYNGNAKKPVRCDMRQLSYSG